MRRLVAADHDLVFEGDNSAVSLAQPDGLVPPVPGVGLAAAGDARGGEGRDDHSSQAPPHQLSSSAFGGPPRSSTVASCIASALEEAPNLDMMVEMCRRTVTSESSRRSAISAVPAPPLSSA